MESFNVALLAAGGAITAVDLVMARKFRNAFALVRPPGHHASPDSHWGFCYFNNIAIAVKKLLKERKVKRVLIIDFDLHFGDGTYNSFTEYRNVTYHHPEASTSDSFIKNLKKIPSTTLEYEILGEIFS